MAQDAGGGACIRCNLGYISVRNQESGGILESSARNSGESVPLSFLIDLILCNQSMRRSTSAISVLSNAGISANLGANELVKVFNRCSETNGMTG